MLRGKLQETKSHNKKVHYHAKSNIYYLDISGDGVKEFISFEFNDGQIKMNIFDRKKKLMKSFDFPVHGYEARPYKISRKKISKDKVLTLIYFFDGKTGYLKKTGTSSLYGFVVSNGELTKIKVTKVASIFLESLDHGNYLRRLYNVGFKDINRDGQYELLINSGSVRRVLYYHKDNYWVGL